MLLLGVVDIAGWHPGAVPHPELLVGQVTEVVHLEVIAHNSLQSSLGLSLCIHRAGAHLVVQLVVLLDHGSVLQPHTQPVPLLPTHPRLSVSLGPGQFELSIICQHLLTMYNMSWQPTTSQ